MIKNAVSLKQIRSLDERVFQEMLKLNCSLSCVNAGKGKTKTIPLRALYDNDREFWLRDSSEWSYFVDSSTIESILEELRLVDLEREQRLVIREESIEKKIGLEYISLKNANPMERVDTLTRTLKRIRGVVDSRDADEQERREAFIEASWYSWMVNKMMLDEISHLEDKDARQISFEVTRLTEKIIESLSGILKDEEKHYTYMHSLVDKSNGATLRHMIRTFVMAHRFVLYFNREMLDRGLASRLRAGFSRRYRKWYSALLPHIPEKSLTLENVFKGGLRPVKENELKIYSAGFLLHDIGKQRYIDYYEGSGDFDRSKVEAHAKTGYRMLLHKTAYSSKIAAIAGFHHEYYGHESGYGYYRDLCSLMQLDNKNLRHDSCISYDLDDLNRFRTLSYLPVKFLEIVDVFDAVTDPGRSYKSQMNAAEALGFIRSEFVENNRKLDIILFDLFVQFLGDEGLVV